MKRLTIVILSLLMLLLTACGATAPAQVKKPATPTPTPATPTAVAPTPSPTPRAVSQPKPQPTPDSNDVAAPSAPYALGVAHKMQALDSDIYKVITDVSPGGGATITNPWIPGHGTAMLASSQYGWYTLEAFDTSAHAYQDFEANQGMATVLQNTCIMIGPTPPQAMLLALEHSC